MYAHTHTHTHTHSTGRSEAAEWLRPWVTSVRVPHSVTPSPSASDDEWLRSHGSAREEGAHCVVGDSRRRNPSSSCHRVCFRQQPSFCESSSGGQRKAREEWPSTREKERESVKERGERGVSFYTCIEGECFWGVSFELLQLRSQQSTHLLYTTKALTLYTTRTLTFYSQESTHLLHDQL